MRIEFETWMSRHTSPDGSIFLFKCFIKFVFYWFANLVVLDPSRFRFAHQTSFVRRHSGLSTMPGVRWIVRGYLFRHFYVNDRTINKLDVYDHFITWNLQVAFFRQFFASVTKVDYMTMRHGFINVSIIPYFCFLRL